MYHADCMEVLPKLQDSSCMIAITSPPYNLGSFLLEKQSKIKRFNNWYSDNMDVNQYERTQKLLLKQLSRVCKSSIFYNHRIQYQWHSRFNHVRKKSNISHPYDWINEFKVWCVIIWNRMMRGMPSPNRFNNQYELIYQINKPVFFDNKILKLSNIWNIAPTTNKIHPCSFPPELVNNCIHSSSKEKQTIIDPYMGSGTTAIQAIKTNRYFVGIEKDKQYFELCCDRISDEERQYTLF